LKLQKDGRVFASSVLCPNTGGKCHKTSARTRSDLQLCDSVSL